MCRYIHAYCAYIHNFGILFLAFWQIKKLLIFKCKKKNLAFNKSRFTIIKKKNSKKTILIKLHLPS